MTEGNRLIYFMNDYSMKVAHERWSGGDYPGHHLWGMNSLNQEEWSVEFSNSPIPQYSWSHLLGINNNNRFALELAASPPASRNIFCGSIHIFKLLGLLRSVGLFRRNLIPMIHHPVVPNAVNRRALANADGLFFLNSFSHDRTVAEMPELSERSHVVGWCVDTTFYDAKVQTLQPNPKLIVAAGKELRDYESLVRGVALVADPDLRVEIYCSAETAPITRDPRVSVYKGGLHGSPISYIDLLGRYQDAIAIAVPMLPVDRTVGMTSVFDAFASRRAVLITQHPSIDAPIEANGLGIVIPPHDAEAWAAAIRSVLFDPSRAAKMGANGRAYAEAVLSVEGYGKRLSRLFDRYFI